VPRPPPTSWVTSSLPFRLHYLFRDVWPKTQRHYVNTPRIRVPFSFIISLIPTHFILNERQALGRLSCQASPRSLICIRKATRPPMISPHGYDFISCRLKASAACAAISTRCRRPYAIYCDAYRQGSPQMSYAITPYAIEFIT